MLVYVNVNAQVFNISGIRAPVGSSPGILAIAGNGVTDDSAALASAVNVGGYILLPYNKTVYISGPIAITQSHTTIDLNGCTIKINSSNTRFDQGVFYTNNTVAVVTDNSPTATMNIGKNWVKYSGYASLSTGQIVQLTGSTYSGSYKYGHLGIIESFHNDTVFTNIAADTTFTVANIHAYTKLNKITIENGTINANSNTSAVGIDLFGCSDCYINRVVYHGTGSQVGLELLSSFNSIVSLCSVDSVTNVTNSLGYGISLNGHNLVAYDNKLYTSKHNLTAGSGNFVSTGIVYSSNICNTYNTLLSSINIDMHGNVRGTIIDNTVNTQSATAIQVRSWGVDVINNKVNLDNSIANAVTLKAIDFLEVYRGYSEISGNEVTIRPGTAANVDAMAIEGTVYAGAPNVDIQNNTFNQGLLVISQNTDNININDNFFNADTTTFSGINASGLVTNFQIRRNTFYNRTTTGSTYAVNLQNSAETNGDISLNDFYQWRNTGSLVKLSSTTTGVSVYKNKFYTTISGSPILDNSTGQQNPLWDNNKIDSLGAWSTVNYATSPTASQLYEGKTILIGSGSTTGTNICNKTGASTWAFVAVGSGGASSYPVYLTTVTASSSTTLDIDLSAYYSIYNEIEIRFYHFRPATNAATLNCRMGVTGTTFVSSGYKWNNLYSIAAGSGGQDDAGAGDATSIHLAGSSSSTTAQSISGVIHVFTNNGSSTFFPMIQFNTSRYNDGTNVVIANGTGLITTAQTLQSFRFLFSSGNIAVGEAVIYGYK